MSRQRRGRDSEIRLAEWLREQGWVNARHNDPYAPGPDIDGVPGYSIEVKSRRGLDLPGWLRQAERQGRETPLLIVRGNGQGVARIHEWAAVMRLGHLLGGEQC